MILGYMRVHLKMECLMAMVDISMQTKFSVAFGKMGKCMDQEHFNLRKMLKNGKPKNVKLQTKFGKVIS
tara:strand:+ start:362 stop:568 length:207 start_codon:yes stop_codon:yes gene_type:complete